MTVLGVRPNWRQFTLLVVVNAFVGSMVGTERVVLPLLAEEEFGLASRSAILSFLASFGLMKALANLAAGWWGDRAGRRSVLLAGWCAGLPVPVILYFAPSWSWVVLANALLGVNQGLAWSSTVIMKIDLAGPQQRGFAMGLNEAAGYLAVSGAALLAGLLSAAWGHREALLVTGGVSVLVGFTLTLFVKETHTHAQTESPADTPRLSFREIFRLTSWGDRNLMSVCQAGCVNNLNDGLAWGLFPLYFAAAGLPLWQVSLLGAAYPAVWGLAQLFTGALSDRIGRKSLITGGMIVQGAAICWIPFAPGFAAWLSAIIALGVGTAMVYPTLLATIGDVAHPTWRASAVGVYRLWRDGGYVAGALLAGVLADTMGAAVAITSIGLLTAVSGCFAGLVQRETLCPLGSMRALDGS